MNLIHSKLRNRLGAIKAHQLIYLHMNQRVLDGNHSVFLDDPNTKTREEQLQLEDMLLQFTQEAEDEDEYDDIQCC